MRKILFAFVAVLWVMAGVQLVENLNQEDEGQIVQAFNKTNCMDTMSKVQVSGSLDAGYKTIGQQKEILKEIAAGLGITGNYEFTEEKKGSQTTVQLYKEAAKAETWMKTVTVENEISENVVETTQYLIVEIQLYDKLECAVLYKENLENLVKEYGVTEEVSLQFSGELPGKVNDEKQKEITRHLLESISAKVCGEVEEGNVYTVYAHTKLIEDYQEIKDKKVNVTVAVTFDEEKNHTRLYLATPLLQGDY